MTNIQPLQAILKAIDVDVHDKTLKLIIASYEAFKEKGENITIQEILKLKE